MDFIKTLRENDSFLTLLSTACDVEILSEFRSPENEFGHLTYSIPGTTFAQSGSGNEYILLKDGSIGCLGSEGACGRIADSLQDFFEFVIHCPYWQDYLWEEAYQDRERLGEFARRNFENLIRKMMEARIAGQAHCLTAE